MDGSTIVAIVAAVIAAASALFAMLQARHAKDQADAAKGQAKAAEDQVEIMRRQLAADEAARNKADAPVLEWKSQGHTGDIVKFFATVVRSPGPITLSVTSIVVRSPDEDIPCTLPVPLDEHPAATGAQIEVPIDLRADKGKFSVRVDIEVMCTEQAEPKRSWPIVQSVTVHRPPRAYVF